MIRIAHAADIHYCPKHLKWVDLAFSSFVSDAITKGCDAAVIAGDSFDSSMGIHEPAVSAYIKQVVRLASAMPTLILQGTYSHDRLGCLDVLKQVPTSYPIYIADKPVQVLLQAGEWYQGGEITANTIADGDALFSCLPSLNKADPKIMASGAKAAVSALAEQWAPNNEAARAAGIATALVSHGTVNGCATESGYAMVSPDHEFDASVLYAFGADAVMLGHIHAFQSWSDGAQTIAYPGSVARLVHGDHNPKGYLNWKIAAGKPDFDFFELPSRQLLEIDYDGPPDIEELTTLAASADDNTYVRIRWSIDQEHAHSVDKQAIRALFEHAAECKLEGVVNPVQSVRAEGIGKAMTLTEKLGYYAATTGDEAALPELEMRLGMLQSMDVDQIVKKITKVEKQEAA